MIINTFKGFSEVVNCILSSGKEFQKRNLRAGFDISKIDYQDGCCSCHISRPKVCIGNGKYEMALYTDNYKSPTQEYAKELVDLINMF